MKDEMHHIMLDRKNVLTKPTPIIEVLEVKIRSCFIKFKRI